MFGDEPLKATDWMGIQQAAQDAQADRMVVLSDVWLDKPDVLDSLHTIFAGASAVQQSLHSRLHGAAAYGFLC